MGTAAYGGKGFKARAVVISAASCRLQHTQVSCQPPPPPCRCTPGPCGTCCPCPWACPLCMYACHCMHARMHIDTWVDGALCACAWVYNRCTVCTDYSRVNAVADPWLDGPRDVNKNRTIRGVGVGGGGAGWPTMDMSMGRCPWHVPGWLSQHKVWGVSHAGLDLRTCRPLDPTNHGRERGGGGEGDPPPVLLTTLDSPHTIAHVEVTVALVSCGPPCIASVRLCLLRRPTFCRSSHRRSRTCTAFHGAPAA